jgi:hypothetical protein
MAQSNTRIAKQLNHPCGIQVQTMSLIWPISKVSQNYESSLNIRSKKPSQNNRTVLNYP